MKRARIPAAAMAVALLLISGCTLSSQDPVYHVMFEKPPRVFDSGVYFQGEQIGEIVSRQTGESLTHTVTISVPERHRELIRTQTAFFVSSGRLQYASLAAFGAPLPVGSAILGFQSKGALLAFRLTNLMQPLPSVAGQEAARLLEEAG